MPPKVKIAKENIIGTAVDIIRREGQAALNARSIAQSLNCSTQPIFSNFENMDELFSQVCAAAYQIYLGFLKSETESGKYPPYKAMGMAYIRFASEERELFKLLFMCDREGRDLSPTDDYKSSVELIMKANGFSYEKAMLFHLESWAFVHGIAVMFATSFLPLEWELVDSMLSDVYLGLRARHLSEVE